MGNHSCPFQDCTFTFNRPYRLQIHIQKHQGIKAFQCTHCDRGYYRRQHLQRHVAEAHQNQRRLEQPLLCDHCDQQFNTSWGLRRHQMRAREKKTARVRQHSCKVCSRSFHTANDLEHHALKHERFRCTVPSCPLLAHNFRWSYYHQHISDYHSEPFKCEHCDKHFFIKSQIRSHVRLHMPKFSCTVPGCNRTFAFHKNMVYHVQVGHGERTFKCNVIGCNWEFKYKSGLNRHIKIHQQNGRIRLMASRTAKNKGPKYLMANKLARLVLKI